MSEPCKEELFRVELEAAADYRTDFELNKYCQEDAKNFCPDVEPGDGRVQDCLVCGNFIYLLLREKDFCIIGKRPGGTTVGDGVDHVRMCTRCRDALTALWFHLLQDDSNTLSHMLARLLGAGHQGGLTCDRKASSMKSCSC